MDKLGKVSRIVSKMTTDGETEEDTLSMLRELGYNGPVVIEITDNDAIYEVPVEALPDVKFSKVELKKGKLRVSVRENAKEHRQLLGEKDEGTITKTTQAVTRFVRDSRSKLRGRE